MHPVPGQEASKAHHWLPTGENTAPDVNSVQSKLCLPSGGDSIGNLHIKTCDYVPIEIPHALALQFSNLNITVLTSRSDASNFPGVLGAPVGKAHHLCINYPSIDAEPYVFG